MMRRAALIVALAMLGFTMMVLAAAPSALAAQQPDAPVAEGHSTGDRAGQHETGINWFYGFVAEKDGAKPSLLWRPKGMEPPLAADLLNSVILLWLVVKVARRPVVDALKKRKSLIIRGMQEAGKMRDDAAARLAGYEDKLKHIDDEIERVKREMREAGERERERILAEAKDKRERMERDGRLLIEQELKAVREMLLRETVRGAVRSAQELLAKQVTAADQQRLADEYLEGVKRADLNAPGGAA